MQARTQKWIAGISLSAALSFVLMANQPLHAQTYTVLHTFTGAADGATPYTGLTMDAHGNLYGTTFAGGAGYGTVFKLTQKGGPPPLGFSVLDASERRLPHAGVFSRVLASADSGFCEELTLLPAKTQRCPRDHLGKSPCDLLLRPWCIGPRTSNPAASFHASLPT